MPHFCLGGVHIVHQPFDPTDEEWGVHRDDERSPLRCVREEREGTDIGSVTAPLSSWRGSTTVFVQLLRRKQYYQSDKPVLFFHTLLGPSQTRHRTNFVLVAVVVGQLV
jgi:hypothetical protein